MPIGFTAEHTELAASVSALVARHAARSDTRTRLDALAAGERPPCWQILQEHGLLTLHLPEECGGSGFGQRDLAVVLEAAAHGLLPGPYLPTALAGAAVVDCGPAPARTAMLSALAAGATAAVALGIGELAARPHAGGYHVTGEAAGVLGAASAEHLVLGTRLTGDEDSAHDEVWFTVPTPEVEVTAERGIDLTRDIGTVSVDLVVAPEQVLTRTDTSCIAATAATLAAAEAAGLIRWCVESVLEYVKVREQFGKPIGSYQAIKHRCARLFITAETAAAAAWDAARAAGGDEHQRRQAASAAAVTCLPAAVDAALDAITIFGGIGFTWEHDVHLYWRRAISLRALLGPTGEWARQLGRLALEQDRNFEIHDLELDEAVRAEIVADVARVAELPAPQRRSELAALGYAAPHYPRPYGRAAGPAEQLAIARELESAGIDQPYMSVGEWALPTILTYGNGAQRERFIGPSLSGEITWCQLFSEPGAGSDLASLATKAARVEGGWRLNGQKVWTSLAHLADWGICLARTDSSVPRHKGLSYFLVDMRAEGIDIRPLRQSTGAEEFNEVFLNDVFVPDDCLVGEPGQGWALARTTLSNERLTISTEASPSNLGILRRHIRQGTIAIEEPDATRVLGELTAAENAVSALNLRSLLARLSGFAPDASTSLAKVATTLCTRATCSAIVDFLGPLAAYANTDSSEATWSYLNLPNYLIGGGTLEIQYNIIAERILGLPR